MNADQLKRCTQFAEGVSSVRHRDELLNQLRAWKPAQLGAGSNAGSGLQPLPTNQPPAAALGAWGAPPAGQAWGQPGAPQQQGFPPAAALPAAPPKPAPVKSQEACIKALAGGDAEAIDILDETYGWEVFDITRTLVAIGPRGGDHLFVLPNDAEFVMGAIDALLATMLFDHTPGQVSYRCDRACRVDRTGFAAERLKDAEYWRTRQLTRGNLVH
jgi:hypothetical protein